MRPPSAAGSVVALCAATLHEWRPALCSPAGQDRNGYGDLLFKPHVLEAPAVVDAVLLQREPLEVRLPAVSGTIVIDDRPRLKGVTTMVNSIYNGWRFEDLRLEQEVGSSTRPK